MNPENTLLTLQENTSLEFAALLDNACTRLKYKHAEYCIRRLLELDTILKELEKELDIFISNL